MKCIVAWGCHAPLACGTFGYCRQRNIDAGGMANVSYEQQAEWKRLDNPEPEINSKP